MQENTKLSVADIRNLILNAGKDESMSGYDLKDDETGELYPDFDKWYNAWQEENEKCKNDTTYMPCIKMTERQDRIEFGYDSNRKEGFEATIVFDKNKNFISDNIINESPILNYIGAGKNANGTISVMNTNGDIFVE